MTVRSSNHDSGVVCLGCAIFLVFDEGKMKLNEEEKYIIKKVLQGATNAQIAAKLEYCESTIKKRMTTIYLKFKVSGRMELVKKCLISGMFEEE